MPRPDEQQINESALLQEYSARHRGPRISLPNGRSVPASAKYRGMVYPVAFNASFMLGDPKAMLLHPMPGAKYVWKDRKRSNTAALIRQEVLRPVGVDEVDRKHPYAMFQRLALAGRAVVAWESLILCEMPPEEADRRINVWDDYAISQLADARDQWATEVDRVSHGAMVGSLTVSDAGPAMNES